MRSHFVLTFCLLVFASCSNGPKPPPPSNVPSAAPLKTASDEQQQIASSAIAAARDVNQKNPAGPAKDAVEGELSVAAASLPVAERKYRDEAFKRINAALVGKPGEAEKLWNVARLDAGILSKRVADLEVQVDSEREAAAKELQRQLDAKDAEIKAANDEAKHAADAKLNFWLQIGCFGLGALSLAGAAATLWVAGPVMAFLGPALGANVTQLLAFIGAGLISLGLLIRAVDHFVAAHPYLFFCGIGAVAIAAIYATALVHGNIHSHVTNPPQATPATFK